MLSTLLSRSKHLTPTSDNSIVIPENKIIKDPIYIAISSKSQIILEKNSQATIIEIHRAEGATEKNDVRNQNENRRIELKSHAKLNHIILQYLPTETALINSLDIQQGKESEYNGSAFLMGGTNNQLNIKFDLNDTLAQCEFRALEIAKANQQLAIHLTINHQNPACKSFTLSRSVVDDRAHAVFTGKIVVHKNAVQTQAKLDNKNLLLSLHAEANSRPELEIYNDDVQCTHGATVGHLDEEALFYLKSRGIPEQTAKQMLIDGFINAALEGIQIPSLKEYIQQVIHGL